ncbi:MAG: Selenocysteine-specific translation elongation factor [Ktedonobacterales bacterium]|nr:MAG: Selenocysteine-specific translation elongation factor [Ktedonobacterales bacterium]
MSCIGTAGHVDHGKSTLVTALTGIDPDRLAEEKARGMTIDLGFAWLTLPSGREASIVDVPGHEAFIKNMLAGVGGIDVALLVVAADEGIMPQTDEHLTILDLLRVQSGVVALTKCDLVEDDWLALVREEIAERLKSTTLASAPIIPCSAVTRAGLPELLAALDSALDAAPGRRDLQRPRLPIDRVFTISGFGAVVTGTLQDGMLHTGQEVEIAPHARRARIRGLQTHKHTVAAGLPGGRLAVNLTGVATSDLQRGDVLALPGTLRPTYAIDVQLELAANTPRPLAHNSEVEVFAGAAQTAARVLLLDRDELAAGATGWAQLRLTHPLAILRGDRFIVRSPSPSLTIGGGAIVEPFARRHRRHDSAVLARLAILARGDPEDILLTALRPDATHTRSQSTAYGARSSDELSALTGLPTEDVTTALADLIARSRVVRIGNVLYATDQWQRLQDDAVALLDRYHQQYPLRPGMLREEWRARLGLSPRNAAAALAALVTAGHLADSADAATSVSLPQGSSVRLSGHIPTFTPEQEHAVAELLQRFRAAPFSPPTRSEAEQLVGIEVTAALIERGILLKISDTLLLEPAARDQAIQRILAHFATHETLTVAEARDLLGVTRKYTLPILEYCDDHHITQRRGDDRTLDPRAPTALSLAASDEFPPQH